MLEKFWHKLEGGKTCLIDAENTYYFEWTDANGHKWAGMRHKDTIEKHGPCRYVTSDSVVESSFKNGKQHGLTRRVFRNETWVSLHENGKEQARFKFGQDWFKTNPVRGDFSLFDDLTAEYFDPKKKTVVDAKKQAGLMSSPEKLIEQLISDVTVLKLG